MLTVGSVSTDAVLGDMLDVFCSLNGTLVSGVSDVMSRSLGASVDGVTVDVEDVGVIRRCVGLFLVDLVFIYTSHVRPLAIFLLSARYLRTSLTVRPG